MDDELIDDVFEDGGQFNPKHYYQNKNTDLNVTDAEFLNDQTPSPTTSTHPGFKSIRNGVISETEIDDGWKSYKIDDDAKDKTEFDDSVVHKVKTNSFFFY